MVVNGFTGLAAQVQLWLLFPHVSMTHGQKYVDRAEWRQQHTDDVRVTDFNNTQQLQKGV